MLGKMKNRDRGFTLIELLIVIAILGFLTMLGLGAFQSSQKKGRDSKRKAELRQIGAALELSFNDRLKYPNDTATGAIRDCGATGASECTWGSSYTNQDGTIYMVTLPKDPVSTYYYRYDVGTGNTSFQLYARLENTLDNDVPKSGTTPQNYGISCGTKNCNYGISSTNTTPSAGRTLVNE